MKIEHVAIWVTRLAPMKAFYQKYFNAQAGEKYVNREKAFESFFLSFDSGARLELMYRPDILRNPNDSAQQITGYAHLAMSVGSRQAVDRLTSRLKSDGYSILDGPRTTGDGYYESVVLDPDNNRVEITE